VSPHHIAGRGAYRPDARGTLPRMARRRLRARVNWWVRGPICAAIGVSLSLSLAFCLPLLDPLMTLRSSEVSTWPAFVPAAWLAPASRRYLPLDPPKKLVYEGVLASKTVWHQHAPREQIRVNYWKPDSVPKPRAVYTISYGVPFRSLRATFARFPANIGPPTVSEGLAAHVRGKSIVLPTAPLWLGALGNAAVYSIAGLPLLSALGAVRRRRRRSRGQCEECGYDRSATAGLPCPECGTPTSSAPGVHSIASDTVQANPPSAEFLKSID
jgi:hypothetical protein